MEALQGTHFLGSEPPFGLAGAPSYSVQNARSNDIDDQAAMLGGWEQRYIQYENGSFVGAVQALTLPSSTLFRKSTNRKLHKRFAPPPKETAFAVLLSDSDPAIFQGRPVGPGDVLVIPGGREHELICHGTFDVVVATFPNTGSDLVNVCGDAAIVRPGVVKGNHAAGLGRWLERVLVDSSGALGTTALADAADIQAEIARKCAELVCDGDKLSDSIERYERIRAVQIFSAMREIIAVHLKAHDEIPSLAFVVGALGVSLRTLEYTCKTLLNVSPQRYLTCLRLHGARRDIRALAGLSSVMEIAFKWGFSHLGRFSIAYRELFGEQPSRTMQLAGASPQRSALEVPV
jgi:AraC family transcriptional regulator, ethanolamine operon transcriptional activator